ncbi:MazG nucleotide pyrophosphohydrolase domain-containing protein [Herbiconiux sp. L3-i23]|uniref:MazG nucleotide pyrophosphohydrolase domain-containing protein n=1 Tax=Herbiconiux sp. L3-i23 TaxID=2905871 RepID=UPI00205AB3FB|nr:MazG nucleotide pyrophosphohydrolase domain-containing protein [Herbiconiux sp. L3-i23]BDI22993.1 hypothetical protein L3i23_17690 [Herbiconiux sp. L3-i23]
MTNDFDGLRTAALAVASSYDELSARTTGRPWTNQEFALGLMGDVGDLAKIVMTLEGTRRIDGIELRDLEHELCDVMWSCLVLANRYGLDLGEAFPRQMTDLLRHIESITPNMSGTP